MGTPAAKEGTEVLGPWLRIRWDRRMMIQGIELGGSGAGPDGPSPNFSLPVTIGLGEGIECVAVINDGLGLLERIDLTKQRLTPEVLKVSLLCPLHGSLPFGLSLGPGMFCGSCAIVDDGGSGVQLGHDLAEFVWEAPSGSIGPPSSSPPKLPFLLERYGQPSC